MTVDRGGHQPDFRDGAQGDELAVRCSDADAVDVARRAPVGGLGLDLHLPGAAEQVEVVGVIAAHRRLQRVEHLRDLDPQNLGPLAVEIEVDLRRRGAVGRIDLRQTLARFAPPPPARAPSRPGRPARRR